MAATTLSKEMLEAHPAPAQVDRDLLARCIDECLACLQSCTACADADLAEDDVAEMRRCIRLCLDCADACDATARLLSRQTDYVAETARAQLASCWELCAICAGSASAMRITTSTAGSAARSADAASRHVPTCLRRSTHRPEGRPSKQPLRSP